MELNVEQLKEAESELKRYLPGSLQKNDLFKDIMVFANDETRLEETLRKSSVVDWTRYLCIGCSHRHTEIFKAVASEKNVPSCQLAVCHVMILEDVSSLPPVDSSEVSLSSLDESHISLLNRTWKFGKCAEAVRMIQNMVTHFPSCCVLDAEGQPVAWLLVYSNCAMGMLYTLPEHRGKGYAKVLICTMAKRLHAEGYPMYCFIEEENALSYKLFTSLGFTEDPACRFMWLEFNEL
ncbi:glycine N-acyltransferase-like protein 3 isoform X2 [Notolabrus celidotus]|uniref:glycine N-acyltransferase-like protein 3 isoform X2 n=1 Tax=Notolabrus celidotus TaxID=1203425 RepID=UPI00148F6618|nr:glycine N-acyltransferase-like protein 3 isoform X2 [Notolabrus celidotus]